MDKNLKIAVVLSAVDKMSRVISGAVDSSVKKFDAMKKRADAASRSAFDIAQSSGAIGLAIAAPLGLAVNAAAEYESMNVSLKTAFQGNEQAARKAFKMINDFAATTPYELEEVMTGFIKLKNMGLDPSTKALTAYGNIASSMGKSLNDMVEAVADAATFEFERLKEFGIKAKQQGEYVTFTFQGHATKIKKTSNNIEAYLKNIGMTKFAGGIEAQSKTFKGQLSTLKDGVKMFSASIGNILIPILKDLMQKVQPILDRVQKWTQENPKLTRTIVLGVAALGALSIAVSGVAFLFGGVAKIVSFASSAFSMASKAIGFASTAFRVLGSVVRVVSMIMAANPIILIIMAIAAAAYIIWKNWDKLKAFFQKLWDKIKQIFQAAWNWIKDMFMQIPIVGYIIKNWDKLKFYFNFVWGLMKKTFSDAWNWIKDMFKSIPIVGDIIKNWDRIKGFFADLWNNVKQKFIGFMDWIMGIPGRMYEAGKNIVKSIWEGIKSMAMKPVEAIKDIVNKIREHLPFSPAKVGPLKDIHRIKLVETIAQSVKPAPLVKAMRATTAAAMVAATPVAASGKSISPVSVGAKSSAPISVNYAPVITMAPGSQNTQDFAKLLKDHEKQIVKLIEEAGRKASRAKY